MTAKRTKSAAEAIAWSVWSDVESIREHRYQPTRYVRIHVFAFDSSYYCATLPGQMPPDGWEWKLVNHNPYHGRQVYESITTTPEKH
jgi:hypothetical protein